MVYISVSQIPDRWYKWTLYFFLFPLHFVTAGSHGTQALLYSTVILSVLAIIQIVINLCLSLYFTTGTWLFSEQKIMPVFCCFVIFFFYCMNSHDSLVFSHIIIVNLPFEKLNISYFHFLNTCLRSIGYFFFKLTEIYQVQVYSLK